VREAVYGMDLMRHLESTGVRESGILVDVHVAGFQDDWRFGEILSPKIRLAGLPVQAIEASQRYKRCVSCLQALGQNPQLDLQTFTRVSGSVCRQTIGSGLLDSARIGNSNALFLPKAPRE